MFTYKVLKCLLFSKKILTKTITTIPNFRHENKSKWYPDDNTTGVYIELKYENYMNHMLLNKHICYSYYKAFHQKYFSNNLY